MARMAVASARSRQDEAPTDLAQDMDATMGATWTLDMDAAMGAAMSAAIEATWSRRGRWMQQAMDATVGATCM